MGNGAQRADYVGKDARDMPGPGHFESNDQFGKNGIKYSMYGKPADAKDNGNPGPGNYEQDVGPTKDRSISYKMGNGAQRADYVGKDARDLPGPGGYDSPERFGKDGLKYSIRGKSPEMRDNGHPGPGTYNDK